MRKFNFLSKSSSQSGSHSSVTLASTVGSQEEFYVSGGNSRGAFTPADVCQTSSVRLNRFTAYRRGAMLKLLSVLVLIFTFGIGQMWGDTYTRLESISSIDESAEYVLGIDGTGFHYEGTSSWGLTALPSAQTPLKYSLKIANDGKSFTAETTIGNTKYYLQVPTSNTFSMATSTGTNTDLIIGTTQVSGTNYAVANKTTTARHLRINGASGLRSYAGTTGTMAYFYKVVSASPCTVTWHVNGNTTTAGNPTTNSSTGSQVTKLPTDPISSDCDGSKVFVGWTATEINGTTNTKPADLFTTAAESPALTGNTDFYAVFANASEGAPTWQKTTSIAVGDVVVFVNETNNYEMTGVSSNLGQATSYTSVQGTYPLTIVAGSTNGSFSFKNGSNYLSYSGSSNQLKTSADKDATSSWTISSSTNGNFKLANVNTTARILQYNHNNGSPRWACYGNSNQDAFQIYKQTASINYSNYATTCCQKYNVNIAVGIENGTVTRNKEKACADETVTLTATPAAHYHFGAWTVSKSAGTITLSPNATTSPATFTMPGEAVTVSATFAINHHNVVFHKNDGSEATDTQDFYYGEQKNLKANAWSRDGFTFNGWNTQANGQGSGYADGTSFTMGDAEVNLYAVWVENSSHAVTINGDAHIQYSSSKPTSVSDGDDLTISYSIAEGYEFKSVAVTMGGVEVAAADILADETGVVVAPEGGITGDVVLTFTIDEIVYTVTFDKGSGICATTSLTQGSYNANIQLPVATPSAGCADEDYGWTFAGWSTAAVGTETATAPETLLAAGSNYKPTADVTLYAVYKRSEGISFDGSAGGNFYIYADVSGTKYYAKGTGTKIVNTTNIAEATSYTFAKVSNGVFTIKTGDNYITKGSSNTDFGTSTNAYNWNIEEGVHGSWRIISSTVDTRGFIYRSSTYNVFGTYTTGGVNGTEYFDVEIAGATTVYYHSTPNCCQKYNVNIAAGIENGTVSADKAKACENDEVTLTATPADHYHFGAWTVAKSEGNVSVTNNKFTMPGEAVTVSATFAINHHNVVFHKNDGSEATDTQDFYYGQTQNLTANAWSREGFNFGGWMNASDGTEADYTDGASFTMGDAEVDLYALWLSNTIHPIAYTANAHITAYPTQPATVDQDDASIAVAFTLETGYKVTGVTVMMGEDELTSGISYTQSTLTITKPEGGFTDNISITFAINEIVYTVTFDKGTGVCATESLTQEHYNTNIQLPSASPSETCADAEYGWTFAGWKEESAVTSETTTAPETLLAAGSNYQPGSDITLYAVYKRSETGEGTEFTGYSQVAHGGAISEGKYLISTGSYTMAGSGKTGASFTPGTTEDTNKEYTIHLLGDGVFTILGPDNKYVGGKDANDGLLFDATEPSANDYKWKYTSNGIQNQLHTSRYLKAFSTSDFRHYNTSNGVLTYLYKRIEETPTTTYYHSTPSCCHKYTIAVNGEIANGSVAVSDNLAKSCAGTEITLTATGTENAGRFKTWSITGLDSYSATTNPLTFNMPESNITVNATFDALYAITKDEQNGTITLGADYAAAGDKVSVSAEANPQYKNPVLTVFETNTPANIITVGDDGKFTMPACAVTARVVCAPALDALVPPTLGTAVPTYQGVTLNWTGVEGNEGYVLTVKQGGVDVTGFVDVAIAKDATSYTIASGLAANTAYTYSIYTKGDGENTLVVNTPANGSFSTDDYPTVTFYYSENGTLSAGESKKILTDITLAEPTSDPCEKKFVGWSTVTVTETDDEPDMMQPGDKYQIPTNANCTIYAVYANVTPGSATWDEITTVPTAGTYAIYAAGYFLKAEISDKDRFNNGNDGTNIVTDSKLTVTPEADCQWEISINEGGKFLLKNGTKYAGGTTSKNQGTLLTDATNTHAQWEITYETNKFVVKNVGRAADSSNPENAYLRQNGGSGWACYSSTQSDAPRFFKRNLGANIATGGYSTTCAAAAAPASVSTVAVSGNPSKTTYNVGEAFDPAGLTVTVTYSDSHVETITSENEAWNYVTWSKDPATFAAEHIGTGKSVSVTATYNSVTSTPATVISGLTVNKIAVSGVSLSQNAATLKVGKTVTLTATVAPANATYKGIEWSTSDGSVATVENGVVTAVAEGTATITATSTDDNTKTATCAVTVAAGIPDFTEDDHEWIKISNASKLVAGRFYVIGVGAKGVTATNDLSGGYLDKVTTSITNGVIASGTLGTNTAIFELGGNATDGWTLYELTDEENTGYLSGTTSSSLAWSESATTTPISFDEDGNAVLGNGSGYRVLYNNSSPRFKPYSGAQTSMSVPQLYMWAELSHSVTFDANGGVAESVPNVERTDEGKIIIPATEPTHSDVTKAFGGWYKSDAPSVLYNAGDEFSTNVDVTLYAKWNTVPTYTVTYIPGGSGTVPAVASYRAGQKVLVVEAALTNPGYNFAGWTVKDADQNVLPLDEDNKFEMPASAVTITATWSRISNQKWALVKHGDALEIDAEYVIAYNSNTTQKALGAISSNIGTAIDVAIEGDFLKGSEAMKVLTLKAGNGGSNYAFLSGTKYLTWSSGNSLAESEALNNASSWTINVDENNEVVIINVGTTARYLQYNASSPRFACYENTQQKVLLFKKVANLIVEDEQTKTAAQVNATDITVKEDGKLTINVDAEDQRIGDITVEDGGELVVTGSNHIKANNVYLSATMASGMSSQMSGTPANLDIDGDVFFDITLGANGTNQQWHAFTVPFPVDVMNGIYDLNNVKLDNEVNYAIMEYHGDLRAKGEYGWKKIRTTLVPGTFYIMATDGYRTTYRFKKKAGAALVAANSKSLSEYPIDGGEEDKDNGWNGVGNPTLMYGKINYNAYVLDPDIYDYVAKPANSTNFVVGTPFFIQAAGSGTMSMLTAGEGANYAPARVKATEIMNVDVTFGNEVYTDHLYISASEDALNEYQTGKDLVRLSMSSTPRVGRIFCNAYGHELTMVYAPMVNDKASYELGLYAPQAGTYSIAAPSMENAELYLTKNGHIIWNLTMSPCELELTQGQNEGYGLILRANAPSTATGVDEVQSDNVQCTKVVIDDHVYILRGGKMYGVDGKEVR